MQLNYCLRCVPLIIAGMVSDADVFDGLGRIELENFRNILLKGERQVKALSVGVTGLA